MHDQIGSEALELMNKKHVPSPLPDVRPVRVIHLCSIPEAVAVLVGASRLFVVKVNCVNSKRRQGMQLTWFGNAIMIRILPQSQRGRDRIMTVNTPIVIPAVRWFIVLCQRKETIA